ncbi:Proliferation-associated protein 2G4 [Sparganum proliferum]
MSDYDSDEEPTASDETVLNKYKVAAECAHIVLQELLKQCTDGANIIELCSLGDKRIVEETSKLYKKEKELKKGIAFPTTISVNNIVDLGAHIDGFAAVVGHTFVVGAKADNKITGRKADVILAAYNAAEATMRLLRPGNDVASEFNCKPVEGVQSHLMRKSVFDGEKSIVLNPSEEQRKAVEKCTFEMYEAWLIDIVVSTGEGKTKEENARPTIYKKNETVYHLKMKASRQFYSEVSSKFQIYPFNIRYFTITICNLQGRR